MAYLLDTVTLSEFRKERRMDVAVRTWLESEGVMPSYLSVITLNEIRFGIRRQERRDRIFAELLEAWYRKVVAQSVMFPLLPVDLAIAEIAADFRSEHGCSLNDSLIAATAKVHGLTLATRNTADFESTGIALFNPWEFAE